jgi:hypothetical protein
MKQQKAYNKNFINKSKKEKEKIEIDKIKQILAKKRCFILAFGTDMTFPEIMEDVKKNNGKNIDYTHSIYSDNMVVEEIKINCAELIERAILSCKIKTEEW